MFPLGQVIAGVLGLFGLIILGALTARWALREADRGAGRAEGLFALGLTLLTVAIVASMSMTIAAARELPALIAPASYP